MRLDHVRHPRRGEFFRVDMDSFENLAHQLKSPLVRSWKRGVHDFDGADINLVEELKDTDL